MTRPIGYILTDLSAAHRNISRFGPAVREAHANLRDAQPGYPTSTGGGGSSPRLNEDGTPSGLDRHLLGNDQAAVDLAMLDALTRRLRNTAADIARIVDAWTGKIEPGSQPVIERKASGGDCLACGTYCSGAHNDRLRAGLCDPCRKAWSRSTLERGDWLLERRRQLAVESEGAA